jgi:hypothetical protein
MDCDHGRFALCDRGILLMRTRSERGENTIALLSEEPTGLRTSRRQLDECPAAGGGLPVIPGMGGPPEG